MRTINDKPLVSVVIPTYNRPGQTIAAMQSVLTQTYTNWEIIVVDDGSTDGPSPVIESFIGQIAKDFNRVTLLSQSNQGAGMARNRGIAEAHGEYIGFLDSDDAWAPDKLEWQLKAIEQFKSESGLCITDARLVNDSGLDLSSFELHGRHYDQTIGIERNAKRLIAESFSGFWMSSMLVRTELVRKIGGFNSDIKFAEDRDLHFRLSLLTETTYVNKLLVRSDRTPSAAGSAVRPWDKKGVQLQAQQAMLESWLKIGDSVPTHLRQIIKTECGALHSQEANWHLEGLRYADARRAISQAVRYKARPGTIAKYALTWLAPAVARAIVPKTRPLGADWHAS